MSIKNQEQFVKTSYCVCLWQFWFAYQLFVSKDFELNRVMILPECLINSYFGRWLCWFNDEAVEASPGGGAKLGLSRYSWVLFVLFADESNVLLDSSDPVSFCTTVVGVEVVVGTAISFMVWYIVLKYIIVQYVGVLHYLLFLFMTDQGNYLLSKKIDSGCALESKSNMMMHRIFIISHHHSSSINQVQTKPPTTKQHSSNQ